MLPNRPSAVATSLSNTSRPARVLEVERERLLVAIEGLEELAVVRAEEVRPDAARHVAAACPMLDLDHLGAHVGQMARAVRPGAVLLDRENAQAFERWSHAAVRHLRPSYVTRHTHSTKPACPRPIRASGQFPTASRLATLTQRFHAPQRMKRSSSTGTPDLPDAAWTLPEPCRTLHTDVTAPCRPQVHGKPPHLPHYPGLKPNAAAYSVTIGFNCAFRCVLPFHSIRLNPWRSKCTAVLLFEVIISFLPSPRA